MRNLVALTQLKKGDIDPILPLFQIQTVPARSRLLSVNDSCQTAWFVGSGVLRAYYFVEERKRTNHTSDITAREVTSWIVPSGGLLTDLCSFLHRKPAVYHIETLQNSKLYTLSYQNYLVIQKMHPEVGTATFEHTLIMADMRVRMMNLRSPIERLEMFEKLYPALKGQLSVNILASYLSIDPATLSRLRGKIRL